jgi:hypothetical protein
MRVAIPEWGTNTTTAVPTAPAKRG